MTNRVDVYFNVRDEWEDPEKIDDVSSFGFLENGFFYVISSKKPYFFQSDIIEKVMVYGNSDFVEEVKSDFVFPFPLIIQSEVLK